MSADTVTVTLTYTPHEARRVASALRYFVSNVDALQEDYDRLILIATACELKSRPKPEEPTGLGAVVEDASGRRFVRYDHGNGWNWLDGTASVQWSHIDAVRVLSEGVTS